MSKNPDEDDDEVDGKIQIMETCMGSHSLSREERISRLQRIAKEELSERLDHILYTEWDPIGVHSLLDFDCHDEYRRYLPKIVDMVLDGASFSEISDQLMVFESYMKGDESSRRRCDVVAVLLSSYGPHYPLNPFQPLVDTTTSESSLQSVLDLVTQTRLDAYRKNWQAVIDCYAEAIGICQANLPAQSALLGACMNNLGQAYSEVGRLEEARRQFEAALPNFGADARSGQPLYLLCLGNLMSNLEHRGELDAAAASLLTLVSHLEASVGVDDVLTEQAKARLNSLGSTDSVPTEPTCERISVAEDDCGRIGSTIIIE